MPQLLESLLKLETDDAGTTMLWLSAITRELLRRSMSSVMGWSMNAVEDKLTSGQIDLHGGV